VVQERATRTIVSARLATVRFIPERGGLLLIGPPGAGKSHIALGLTLAAIQAGHTALHRSAFDLAQNLPEAQPSGTRGELIGCLWKVDLLAIERLGMRRLAPTAAADLLEVFTRRYKRGAIILTANRPLPGLGPGSQGYGCRRRYPQPLPDCRGGATAGTTASSKVGEPALTGLDEGGQVSYL
jgi:DNA replication protein DnaC